MSVPSALTKGEHTPLDATLSASKLSKRIKITHEEAQSMPMSSMFEASHPLTQRQVPGVKLSMSPISSHVPHIITSRHHKDEAKTAMPYNIYTEVFNQITSLEPGTIIDCQIESCTAWPLSSTQSSSTLPTCQRSSYMPRVGEVVLCTEGEYDILWNVATLKFGATRYHEGELADWQAGLVVDIDANNAAVEVRLLSPGATGTVSTGLVHATARISLRNVRPMACWVYALSGLRSFYPHSVFEALRTINSLSAVTPYRLKASHDVNDGIQASLFCRGIYLGHELLLVGDFVTLLSIEGCKNTPMDLLEISQIMIRLVGGESIDAAVPLSMDNRHICVHVRGRPYTTAPERSFGGFAKSPVQISSLIPNNVQLYHLLDPAKLRLRALIPFDRILGRCFGHEAIKDWFSPAPLQDGSGSDMNMQFNPRLDSPWTWAESRLAQLGISSI